MFTKKQTRNNLSFEPSVITPDGGVKKVRVGLVAWVTTNGDRNYYVYEGQTCNNLSFEPSVITPDGGGKKVVGWSRKKSEDQQRQKINTDFEIDLNR